MLPIFYSDHFLEHDTGPYHPENPGRLRAIVNALENAPFAHKLEWRSPTPIDAHANRLFSAIHAVHPSRYVEAVKALSLSGGGHIDPDTVVSSKTYDVALLAVSAWLDGVDAAVENHRPAFVVCRPPGHHAEAQRGMGFCIFSNAAIAATYALTKETIHRVAILDWDVHHGNGTQAIVETNPHIAYCSLHQSPFYPGTGDASETGKFNNVLNCPMPAGSQLSDYQPVFEERILPFLTTFAPDVLIVSAGYDAVRADPLASMSLQPTDFGVLATYCLQVTPAIAFGLEGGYDHTAISESVVATLEACLTA
ncbi:MAG: histone deacetylase [Leptolyngbyaceae bacterium]|nr:histone deacetylase [Leptolyngbyaceae bacterium]